MPVYSVSAADPRTTDPFLGKPALSRRNEVYAGNNPIRNLRKEDYGGGTVSPSPSSLAVRLPLIHGMGEDRSTTSPGQLVNSLSPRTPRCNDSSFFFETILQLFRSRFFLRVDLTRVVAPASSALQPCTAHKQAEAHVKR